MCNLALCDDKQEELDAILSLLDEWQGERDIPPRSKVFQSAAELLAAARLRTFQGADLPVSRLSYPQLQKDYMALLFGLDFTRRIYPLIIHFPLLLGLTIGLRRPVGISLVSVCAAYQHDMRHHLAAISAFLGAGKPKQAESYIRQVQADIEAITPKRFCENELVNLLCSAFSAKAERMGVRLTPETALPM